MVEYNEAEDPAMKVTVPPDLTTGSVIFKVLISAFVDEKVQVETPDVVGVHSS